MNYWSLTKGFMLMLTCVSWYFLHPSFSSPPCGLFILFPLRPASCTFMVCGDTSVSLSLDSSFVIFASVSVVQQFDKFLLCWCCLFLMVPSLFRSDATCLFRSLLVAVCGCFAWRLEFVCFVLCCLHCSLEKKSLGNYLGSCISCLPLHHLHHPLVVTVLQSCFSLTTRFLCHVMKLDKCGVCVCTHVCVWVCV